ncbi:MAG: hypothetical protein IKQ92_01145 [Clostridia bacterium]|nr:hypothetical protein [Clostridia bacterium]
MLKDFSKEVFDVVIQAGQSNAEGCGMGETEDAFGQDGRIWYLNNDFTISLAAERVWGNEIASDFSLSFAREYLRAGLLAPERKILIVRSAVGGTGFRDNRWKPQDDLFLRMTDMIKTAMELNPANRLVALIWHQGETDAGLNAGYEEHYNNLMTLYRLTADGFGVPEIPFIAGDFVQQWKTANAAICEPVIRAIRDVCRDVGGAFVETDGLCSNTQEKRQIPLAWEDTIHFSRRSLVELGKRYFAAYRGILAKNG